MTRKHPLPPASTVDILKVVAQELVSTRTRYGMQERRASLLEAIVDLGKACNQLAEYHVRRLIESGASWTEIADALGTTRQAAWQRYGPERA